MRCPRFVFPLLVVVAAHNASADSVTKESFDAAARNYRIHVYETYRTNRGEYDRRIEQSLEVASVWNKLEDESQKQEVFKWFAAAEGAKTPPAVPGFVSDEALVIRTVKPKESTEKLAAHPADQPDWKRPAFPSTATSPSATKNKSKDKPGFFSALTKALVSKPKRQVNATKAAEPEAENFVGIDNADQTGEDLAIQTEAAADNVAAEVDDETEFGLAEDLAFDQESELSSEVIQFNVDCEAVFGQLQDEAALDLGTLSSAVAELEELAIQFVSIQQSLDTVPAEQRGDFPDPQPTEELVHLAIERTQSPETWLNDGTVSDEDQQTLSLLASRLEGLLQD